MDPIVKIKDLKVFFSIKKGFKTLRIKAVDGVSFSINRGETMGLIGESGSGKTTIGKVITGLEKATEGSIIFVDKNKKSIELEQKRNLETQKKIQMIFQDPYSSLNPRIKVWKLLEEGMKNYKVVPKSEIKDRVIELMKDIGMREDFLDRYPSELSGGQRQRIAIARAISVEPEFIVCDEVVSALDVSIQAQILELLKELQRKFNLSYLFITHDLAVAEYVSDYILAIYKGKIVEGASASELISNPLHPYTKLLLESAKLSNLKKVKKGEKIDWKLISESSKASQDSPCPFFDRCVNRLEICRREPSEIAYVSKDHFVVCNLFKNQK